MPKRELSEIEDGDEDSVVDTEEFKPKTSYTNKQRVLILSSRGITARYRHLLEDFKKLIPHHKKDNKLDDKGDIQAVNEIADMKSCNQILYLETRKHQDLYMYLGRTPEGPSAKFHVVNIHTMDELKLTGNCMLGSRPLLNFDSAFDSTPQFQLMKQLLADAFGTPFGHPKSKPFNDRVMSFFVIKNNICKRSFCTLFPLQSIVLTSLTNACLLNFLTLGVRNYQIIDKSDITASLSNGASVAKKTNESQLVEIGPRLVLIPIRIFNGSLGGPTLYQNPAFVSPNDDRAAYKKRKGYASAYANFVLCIHLCYAHSLAYMGVLLFFELANLISTPSCTVCNYIAEIAMCSAPLTPCSEKSSCKRTSTRRMSCPASMCSNKVLVAAGG
jgi:ribosome biogenesis protein BRX1